MYASTEQRNRERVQALADKLYRERRHYLLRIARRNGAADADADDAVNDAFAAFIDKFDPASGSPPLGWLTFYADLCVMPTWGRKAALHAGIASMRSA